MGGKTSNLFVVEESITSKHKKFIGIYAHTHPVSISSALDKGQEDSKKDGR